MALPTWNGADYVYTKLTKLAETIQSREYAAQRAKDKRKSFRFSPNEDGVAISEALGRGDEEECKALLAKQFYVQSGWIAA